MALHSHDDDVPRIDRLAPFDVPEALTFLHEDPVLNVYLIALILRDALARPRDEWWAARRGGRIVAMLYLGAHSGAVLAAGQDCDAIRRLGEIAAERRPVLPRRFQVIGERDVVAALLEQFPGGGMSPRLSRTQHYLALSADRLPPLDALPELRHARREDYPLLYESGALLRAEELLEDPRDIDPIAYARRVEEDCRDGCTWVWRDGRGLCFRASVSALTADAAQVSGVYTPPALRGHGVARRAFGELCTRLLQRSRHVCLFVNDFNAPAIALYKRLGFVERASWASAFFARR